MSEIGTVVNSDEDDDATGVDSHAWVMKQLQKAIEIDEDQREEAIEAHLIVDKPGHMWQEDQRKKAEANDKPMLTFDMLNKNIDLISGHMQQLDFGCRVSPAGGKASEEGAETREGLMRHVENISFAKRVYDQVGRNGITCGFDAVEVVQEYASSDSFDQDLIIKAIPDAVNRVFFGPHSEPDASDAPFCFVLYGLTEEDFKAQYPDATALSDSYISTHDSWDSRPELKMLGSFRYFREEDIDIILMSNGDVYKDDEKFQTIKDELARAQVIEKDRRTVKRKTMYTRLFSESGWLEEESETVFRDYLNVIPYYANFKVVDGKIVYWGYVRSQKDPQFALNYSMSREIEESALTPRVQYWMTPRQALGHEAKLSKLNETTEPVMFYNHDPDVPGPPQQRGGAPVNPQLRTISTEMRAIMDESAGMYHANMGQDTGNHSGKAIEALQGRGDLGNNKYMAAREVMQAQICRVAVRAFESVYTPGRQVRILGDDGTQEVVTIGQTVRDEQTRQIVVLNDLSDGSYGVVCEAGPRLANQQNETVRALTEIGAVDPSMVTIAGDILANNVTSPGMKQVAERKRQELFNASVIPESQWTEEERAMVAAAQQNTEGQEDPMAIAAQAELLKGQAAQVEAKTEQLKVLAEIALKSDELDIERAKVQLKWLETTEKLPAEIQKLEASASRDLVESFNKAINP